MVLIRSTEASSYITCATCKFRSCFSCRTPAHLPMSCAQYKASLNRSTEEAKSKKWLVANAMLCTGCGRWCQKTSGCDHMTCAKPIGCGAEWCYKCGANYKD